MASAPNPVKLTDTTIVTIGPQMTAFNGQLYLAWLSSNNDGFIYYGWYNGTTTLQGHGRFYANACTGLGMTAFNGALYIAYGECLSDNTYIDFASGTLSNGVFSFVTTRDPADTTGFAPALTTYNLIGIGNFIFIAWRGTNSSNSVFLGSYPGYGNTLTPTHVQTYDCSSSDMGIGPSLTGGLELAWRGCTNNYIYVGSYNGPFETGHFPLNTQSLNIPSSTGPGLCASFGHLYVAWADYPTDRLEVAQFA